MLITLSLKVTAILVKRCGLHVRARAYARVARLLCRREQRDARVTMSMSHQQSTTTTNKYQLHRKHQIYTTIMRAFSIKWMLVSIFVALFVIENAGAFTTMTPEKTFGAASKRSSFNKHPGIVLKISQDDESSETDSSTKQSLEDKMKSWEASEEEIKASTLGGVGLPSGGGDRSDAFDIGLYIAFPFMVLASLAFAFFPFIMDKIDVSSVGPPPMV